MKKKTILITGCGSGLGRLTALTLGKIGHSVIATTETISQAKLLEKDANDLKIPIMVEKIDITNHYDRKKAAKWDIDILVNNAAVKEGGALVDIPESNLRKQYEVNVFGTLLFTQNFIKQMIEKGTGKIIFISSVSGLMVNPFSGPYASSKYAIEAIASTLQQELQEFNIKVATINPGPYLTGFNDREFNSWEEWKKASKKNIFNYQNLSFPFQQIDPAKAIPSIIRVILGQKTPYRNVIPKILIPAIHLVNVYEWVKKTTWRLGKRNLFVEMANKNSPSSNGEYMF